MSAATGFRCAGVTVCRSCQQRIGLEIEYKKGTRLRGYSLTKDSVMWRLDGEDDYMPVKKWSKVPFTIEEEKPYPDTKEADA